MTCIKCGACCREIVVPAHQTIAFWRQLSTTAAGANDRADSAFFVEHWHLTGAQRRRDTDEIVALRYRCDMLDDATSLCKAYDARPPVCVGFPLYGNDRPLARAMLHPGCGYKEKP